MLNRIIPVILLFLLNGCVTHNYYLSPVNASSTPYRPTPLVSDSLRSAFYVNGTYTVSGANEDSRDLVTYGQLSVHASHHFGYVQMSYGALVSLGTYRTGNYTISNLAGYDTLNTPIYDTAYHITGKARTFGTYGFFGSINLVIPHRRGEWRALGVEANYNNEFGDYYNFRKNLSDSAADVLFRKHISGSVGIFTEIIMRNRKGGSYGFKFALNWMTNPQDNYSQSSNYGNYRDIFPLAFFSTTFHETKNQFTGFIQLNYGVYAKGIQFGMSYRFAKVKLPHSAEVKADRISKRSYRD